MHGVPRLGLLRLAVLLKAAGIGLGAVAAGLCQRRLVLLHHGLRLGDPAAHFAGAAQRLVAQVVLCQQAAVVAAAGVGPTVVHMRHGDGAQRQA